jgi:hypothetical protein
MDIFYLQQLHLDLRYGSGFEKRNETVLPEKKIRNEAKRKKNQPGKPSSDTHDEIRKITLKTTTTKTKTFNRKSLVYVFGRKR